MGLCFVCASKERVVRNCHLTRRTTMSDNAKLPHHYTSVRERYPQVCEALEGLGTAVRTEGPIDSKMSHLIQFAAAAAN